MKKFLITLIIFLTFGKAFSYYTETELKLYYDKVYLKLEEKFDNNETKIQSILEKLDTKLNNALEKTNSKNSKDLLETLISINTKKINSLGGNQLDYPEYVGELLENGYKFLNVSDKLEYYDNGRNRINFESYYPLDSNNYGSYLQANIENGTIIKYKNGYIVLENYEEEKKYKYEELENIFKDFYNASDIYSLENGVYYIFSYSYYNYFDDEYGVYLRDLTANSIDTEKSLLLKNNEKYFFVKDYKKTKIISENIISNIKNKETFLENLIDDNTNSSGDYDDILEKIKTKTTSIITGISENEEKIKLIYNRIIKNISYYENYSDGNKEIFSGVLTYENKTGVCDGYTKLFLYMLSFAGIEDVEIKLGYVYNSEIFPDLGHVWVKIGELYYDPTFDDPIGGDGENDFYYYAIPYEVMYIDRFEGNDIPENLKNMNLEDREKLVLKNIYEIYEEYKEYSIINKIKNRVFLGLEYDEKITIDELSEKITFYEVKDGEFYENGDKKNIYGKFKYYSVDDESLENFLLNPNIDMQEMFLLKRFNDDGTFSYRLAYDFE